MRSSLLWVTLVWAIVCGVACDQAPPNACSRRLVAGTDNACTVRVGFTTRTFFVHVPMAYTGQPLPLVVDLHGTGGTAQNQRMISGWINVADNERLIVVHPQALRGRVTGRTQWNAGDCCEEGQTANDLAFMRALVATTRAVVAVDAQRVFATGLSSGGVMAHFLGCQASEIFNGIAPISFQLSSGPCAPANPVTMIEFHAPTDQQRPFNGHNVRRPDGSVTVFPSAPASAARWAAIDRCSLQPQVVLQRGNSVCVEFPGCVGARVQFCAVDGAGRPLGGHVLYTNNSGLNLAQTAWDLLETAPR